MNCTWVAKGGASPLRRTESLDCEYCKVLRHYITGLFVKIAGMIDSPFSIKVIYRNTASYLIDYFFHRSLFGGDYCLNCTPQADAWGYKRTLLRSYLVLATCCSLFLLGSK
jgi:hypothetical protein